MTDNQRLQTALHRQADSLGSSSKISGSKSSGSSLIQSDFLDDSANSMVGHGLLSFFRAFAFRQELN